MRCTILWVDRKISCRLAELWEMMMTVIACVQTGFEINHELEFLCSYIQHSCVGEL